MGVASVVMKDLASDVLRDEAAAAIEAAGDVGPVGKLQALLTKVKFKECGGVSRVLAVVLDTVGKGSKLSTKPYWIRHLRKLELLPERYCGRCDTCSRCT